MAVSHQEDTPAKQVIRYTPSGGTNFYLPPDLFSAHGRLLVCASKWHAGQDNSRSGLSGGIRKLSSYPGPGESRGIGLGGSVKQVIAPLVATSSVLLYIR